MKNKIFRLIEKGAHGNRLNKVFDYFILALILLSIIAIILESLSDFNKNYSIYLRAFNIFSVAVFSVEYILRLYVSDLTHPSENRLKSALKFMFSIYGLIDLLAILPFYLPLVVKMDLRFLRVLRLTRFLRILKVNRYNDSLVLIGEVIKEKKPELAVTGFVTFLILIISSFLMYYVEGEAQPELFPNILASMWWAVATLTTVGYGDVYPVTVLGKIISGVIAIVGIGIIALPTGIISSGFMSKIEDRKKRTNVKVCSHCGKDVHDL